MSGMIVIFLITFCVVIVSLWKKTTDETGILREIRSKNGYIRMVEREEYEFFRKLVLRDAVGELTEEALDRKTKEKINRANAEFLLGNQMGLCKPYSFAGMKLDLENENTQRRIKKEQNEVFYGPEQFDLSSYYIYISGNLKLDMVSFITSNADFEIQQGAKAYFKENREKYRTLEQIEYVLNENGKEEQRILLWEEMSTLEKTDSQLFDFLYQGKEGGKLEYVYQGQLRTIAIVSVKYEKLTYKNNAERVMRDYITNVYLENWILEIEKNSTVEFKL